MQTEETKKLVPVIKSLNTEKRLATFVVLEPQDAGDSTTDLHGDWYDAEAVEQACHDFNTNCRKANLYHMLDTTGFEFVESYILPIEAEINSKVIKAGTWLAVVKAKEDWIWDGIKDGTFDGLSIQCVASYEDIKTEEE